MYELSAFTTFLTTTAAGITLSIIQELGQRYGWPWITAINQKLVAIILAITAGLIAASFELLAGIDLFSDIAGPVDIILVIGSILFAGQATWALLFNKSEI